MTHSGYTVRRGGRAVRCGMAILVLALMLAQTGCDDFFSYFVESFVCVLGGAGDCTDLRAATAIEQFAVAKSRCENYKRQCDQLCVLAQQAVEVVAEECGNQEQQFQSSGLPGEFTCHLDDETERRLNEAKQQVSACRTPPGN